jgi:hypothetical protein
MLDPDERLVGQPGQQPEHLARLKVGTGRDLLGGGQREPAGEDRQPPEHRALVGVEQLVAPVERGPHGLVPGRRHPRAAD